MFSRTHNLPVLALSLISLAVCTQAMATTQYRDSRHQAVESQYVIGPRSRSQRMVSPSVPPVACPCSSEETAVEDAAAALSAKQAELFDATVTANSAQDAFDRAAAALDAANQRLDQISFRNNTLNRRIALADELLGSLASDSALAALLESTRDNSLAEQSTLAEEAANISAQIENVLGPAVEVSREMLEAAIEDLEGCNKQLPIFQDALASATALRDVCREENSCT